jgi:hypothetical protein
MDPAHARMPISHEFVTIRFECPRQRIDRQWNIVLRFCDIVNKGDLLASKFEILKNRVFSEDSTKDSWNTEFGEARRGKRISSDKAGAAAVPCDILAR